MRPIFKNSAAALFLLFEYLNAYARYFFSQCTIFRIFKDFFTFYDFDQTIYGSWTTSNYSNSFFHFLFFLFIFYFLFFIFYFLFTWNFHIFLFLFIHFLPFRD